MSVEVVDLRCNGTVTPLGAPPEPRLSWRFESADRGVVQTACEVQVATGPSFTDVCWQSGRRDQRRAAVTFTSASGAGRRLWWRVRAWTTRGETEWSEASWFEPGRAAVGAWTARFIGPPAPSGDGPEAVAPVLLRKRFVLEGQVAAARLVATARGIYELTINGTRVGDEVLAPGWTAYDDRFAVSTFDVADLLHDGENVLAATVAEGWFRGRIGVRGGRQASYGTHLGLFAELDVDLGGGRQATVATDGSWTSSTGSIVAAGIYDGETIDLRLEPHGWTEPGFDDASWSPAVVLDHDLSVLFDRWAPPVRRIADIAPAGRLRSPGGHDIVDFGQNLVGWVRLPVRGPSGSTVTVRHAEVLDQDGELFTRALNDARATDTVVLAGAPSEVEPRFTFHGFRYAEIVCVGGAEVDLDALRAVVVSTDNVRTGAFECSDPLVNRLQQNIEWGWRGNSVSVPTDCPQRSERLGWTGDAQVFGPTACFLTDAEQFLSSWLADLAADQLASGSVPMVVPDVLPGGAGAAAWGDVAVVLPWTLYEAYGGDAVLVRQYESMRAWVDYEAERAGDDLVWDGDFQFGDWCDPTAPPDKPGSGKTDRHLIAQGELVRSATLLGRIAGVIGRPDDERRYGRLAADARAAFRDRYLDADGLPTSRTQTACALVLEYGLVDGDERARVGSLLVELVRENGNRLATGFVGTPILLPALSSIGRTDVAYDLLLQRACPSWLYSVVHGATTVWERWDAIQPDGTIHPGEMLSFNHYAYGAVGMWLYRTVAGLAPAAPGYERIRFAPRPGGRITWAAARLHAVPGLIESAWQLDGEDLRYSVTIPPNATGTVALDVGRARLEIDGSPLTIDAAGVLGIVEAGSHTEVELGSGRYELTARGFGEPVSSSPASLPARGRTAPP